MNKIQKLIKKNRKNKNLSSDDAGRSNTGGVLSGSGVDHGHDEHLHGVLVREDVDQLQSVLHDAHSHQLLAVVAAVAHQRTHETLYYWALKKLFKSEVK